MIVTDRGDSLSEGVQGERFGATELRMVRDEVNGVRHCVLRKNHLQVCWKHRKNTLQRKIWIKRHTFCLGVLFHALSASLHVGGEDLSQSDPGLQPGLHSGQNKQTQVGQRQFEGPQPLVETGYKAISDFITRVLQQQSEPC